MLNSADLPNDINALKALLLASEQTVRERDAAIAAHDELVSGLRAYTPDRKGRRCWLYAYRPTTYGRGLLAPTIF